MSTLVASAVLYARDPGGKFNVTLGECFVSLCVCLFKGVTRDRLDGLVGILVF